MPLLLLKPLFETINFPFSVRETPNTDAAIALVDGTGTSTPNCSVSMFDQPQ